MYADFHLIEVLNTSGVFNSFLCGSAILKTFKATIVDISSKNPGL